jgi:hypothetical protein
MSLMDETSQYDARIIGSFIRSNGKGKREKMRGRAQRRVKIEEDGL